MGYQPFLIAPFNTGLDTDQAPWLLPKDAFSSIVNAHIHNGIVQKRNGYRKLAETGRSNRIMGLHRFIDSTNIKHVVAFDTERAYAYNTVTETFDELDAANIFTGGDTDFIWGENWSSTASSIAAPLFRLYFTNGKSSGGGLTDGIRYYDGDGATTSLYQPLINSTVKINGCKLIFAIGQRLLLLHTFEGNNSYPQRARWSKIQDPDAADSWDDAIAGKGGYVDAPTGDNIISARPIQNMLIVFFTDSVWSLRQTPDPALPFRWDKINNFRSTDAKMGTASYDRAVMAVGNRGITATDGVDTQRVDNRIELFVKEQINAEQIDKCFMLRSYGERKLWMLYAGKEDDDPSNALVFDDESKAFSTYSIGMNVLGYGGVDFDAALSDFTDAAATDGKLPLLLSDTDETLQGYFWDKNDEIVLGGDRSGNVYIMETDGDDDGGSIDMELTSAGWNPFIEKGVECQFGYVDLYVDADEDTLITVEFFKNDETDSYRSGLINCLPNLREIAPIVNLTIKSPATSGVRINLPDHGLSTGKEIYIYGINESKQISGGPFSVTVVDANHVDIAVDATTFVAWTSGGVAVEGPFVSGRTWKRVYGGGIGYEHRIRVTSTGSNRVLNIHGFRPWFRERGRRTI